MRRNGSHLICRQENIWKMLGFFFNLYLKKKKAFEAVKLIFVNVNF